MRHMGQEFALHVVELLELAAHPIDGVDQVAQFAGSPDMQRSSKIPLPYLFDVALQLSERPKNRVAGDTGQSDSEDEGEQYELLGDGFRLRRTVAWTAYV